MVDLAPYLEDEAFYRDANIAMIEWLATQSPEVWVALAPALNWDCSIPTLHWLIDQPACDRAVAAVAFFLGADTILDERMTPERAAQEPDARLLMAIVRRAVGRGYAAEYAIPDDSLSIMPKPIDYDDLRSSSFACLPGVAFPEQLLGPFGSRTAILPDAANPNLNPRVWDLFNDLGAIFGTRPTV